MAKKRGLKKRASRRSIEKKKRKAAHKKKKPQKEGFILGKAEEVKETIESIIPSPAATREERVKHSPIFATFFVLAFVVFIIAFLHSDWISIAVSGIVMLLSLMLFRSGKRLNIAVKKHRYYLYIIIWVVGLLLAILSIIMQNNFSAVIALCVMFFCSLISSISSKKTKTISLKRDVEELNEKGKRYETDLDRLLILLEKYKKLKVMQICEGFNVSRDTVEGWADTLERHCLLKINFPAFGAMELIYVSEEDRGEKRKNEAFE